MNRKAKNPWKVFLWILIMFLSVNTICGSSLPIRAEEETGEWTEEVYEEITEEEPPVIEEAVPEEIAEEEIPAEIVYEEAVEEEEIPETAEEETEEEQVPETEPAAEEEILPEPVEEVPEPTEEEPVEEVPVIEEKPLAVLPRTELPTAVNAQAASSSPVLEEENYNLKYLIQSGYQIVAFGDVTINLHTMGSLLVQGNLTEGTGANGIADSPYSVKPSYVAGYVNGRQGFNNRQHQSPVQVLYVGSSNSITNNGKTLNGVGGSEGYNHGGVVAYSDNYVDFDKLKSAMVSLSASLQKDPSKSYDSFYDWKEITDINAGTSVVFNNLGTNKVKLKINGSSSTFTVINITDKGTVYVPQLLTYNGQSLSTDEDNEDMPVIFNFPNADKVIIPADMTPSFGHILAPNADVYVETGNYNGLIVCKNIETNGEGHLRNYHGDLPGPSTYEVKVNKTDSYGKGISGARLGVYDAYGNLIEEFTSNATDYILSLEEGTYELRELQPPENYRSAASIWFTVDSKGTVKVNNTVQSGARLTMVDIYEPYILIEKVDENGDPLTGAELTVFKENGTVVQSFQTDGTVQKLKLDAGSYILKETFVPEGYQTAEDIPFKVQADGKLYVNNVLQDTLTITVVDKTVPVIAVLKTDHEGHGLAGASLAVTDTQGNILNEFVSETTAITLRLLPGDYILKETDAPEGYEKAEDIAFTVNEEGRLVLNGAVQEEVLLTMVDEYKPVSAELEALKILKGKELEDGEFSFLLTNVHSEKTGTERIWHEGHWEETDVEGYYEDVWHDGYYETIWHDGHWEEVPWGTQWRYGENWRWTGRVWERWVNGYSEKVWHDGYSEKVWHEGSTERTWHEGYWEENEIHEEVIPPMPEGTEGDSLEVTNDKDGKVSFGTIIFPEEGIWNYTIREVTEDKEEGILYDTAVYTVTVEVTRENGILHTEVTYKDAEGNVLTEGPPQFINTKQTSLILKKVNNLDRPLAKEEYQQIRFRIMYTDKDETEKMIRGPSDEGLWIPDDEGVMEIGYLEEGTYSITEVNAPEGYVPLSEAIIVTVNEDGEVTYSYSSDAMVYQEETEDTGKYILMIRNYAYIKMPETGRNSHWYFQGGGLMAVLAGIYILYKGKQRDAESCTGESEVAAKS